MKTARLVSYKDLPKADLVVDAVYEGSGTDLSGEPISELLNVRNLGGFRVSGSGEKKNFAVLYTSGENRDWPDELDVNTGRFTYYGDNRQPGRDLHSTNGNRILKRVFTSLHSDRSEIPPFFVFRKSPTVASSLSVQFRGLAVPGFLGLPSPEDLVAVWKTSDEQRFQNYMAVFTILDVSVITREWLNNLHEGNTFTENMPGVWREWAEKGRYRALTSESTTVIRSQDSQMPDAPDKILILNTVWEHFKEASREFEFFASYLFRMHDQRVIIDEVTHASVDGGRDAIGRYRLGLADDPLYVEFSLEAKCYRPPLMSGQKANTVGVKEVSRLISRIRYRQFGVLVTTSVIGRRAYEEVRKDRHPVIFFCGKDITDILTKNGFNTSSRVKNMLEDKFPVS